MPGLVSSQPSKHHAVPKQLRHTTVVKLLDGLSRRDITSAQLVATYVTRIQQVNPQFKAVVELSSKEILLKHAKAMDSLPGRCCTLQGLPILLKDNIPTHDNSSACGSLALVGAKPPHEAAIVKALRAAGAIVLGKGNMAEWSGFRSTSGCSGWSGRGGQTKGIFVEGMKASGSSGGCAVAVALGLCAAALGTETFYSIVSPAERSGIIGFKPTRNLLPTEGIIYASERLDTVGLLARTVQDAMFMLLSLAEYNKHLTLGTRGGLEQGLRPICQYGLVPDLTGLRIGIPWHMSSIKNLPQAKASAFKLALSVFENAGAILVHDVIVTGAAQFESQSSTARNILLDTDMKMAINNYLSKLVDNPQNINNLTDLIEFTKACPGEEYPTRNVAILERANTTSPTDPLYLSMLAKESYFTGTGGIAGALARHNCQVLLMPTLDVTLQSFAAKAGSPVLSVPMGVWPTDTAVEKDKMNGLINVAPGIPFSAFLFGDSNKDEHILKVGHVLDKILGVREGLLPYLEPTAELADCGKMSA